MLDLAIIRIPQTRDRPMDRMHHQLELIGETATLYVQGTLAYEDIGTLIALCDSMPDGVRTLRLDLHGLGQLSAEATDTAS